MTDPQPYERASTLSKKEIIINNLIGGIAWALGATVGISLVFALLALIAKNVNLIPVVGTFVSDIINFVLSHNRNI